MSCASRESNPRDQSVDFVKRVIGLPGDRVALWHGRLTLNGHEVPEEFQPIRDRDDTGYMRSIDPSFQTASPRW